MISITNILRQQNILLHFAVIFFVYRSNYDSVSSITHLAIVWSSTSHIQPRSGHPHYTSSHDLVSDITCSGSGGSSVVEWHTCNWKVLGLSPGRSRQRIFFSRLNCLCWLLFRYPFHPRVTAAARKRSHSAGGRLQLNTHTPYIRLQTVTLQTGA